MADRSIPQNCSTAKTGWLGTGWPIWIVECLAALLSFLPSGDPDKGATSARAPDRESVRISMPALRNVDWIQDRQSIGDWLAVAPQRRSRWWLGFSPSSRMGQNVQLKSANCILVEDVCTTGIPVQVCGSGEFSIAAKSVMKNAG